MNKSNPIKRRTNNEKSYTPYKDCIHPSNTIISYYLPLYYISLKIQYSLNNIQNYKPQDPTTILRSIRQALVDTSILILSTLNSQKLHFRKAPRVSVIVVKVGGKSVPRGFAHFEIICFKLKMIQKLHSVRSLVNLCLSVCEDNLCSISAPAQRRSL